MDDYGCRISIIVHILRHAPIHNLAEPPQFHGRLWMWTNGMGDYGPTLSDYEIETVRL